MYICSWDQKGCEQSVPQYPVHWRCDRESKTTSCSGTRSALSLTCECTCTCVCMCMCTIPRGIDVHVHVHVYNVYVYQEGLMYMYMCALCAESLAYLTAATHGLTEEAQNIADTLQPIVEKVHVHIPVLRSTVLSRDECVKYADSIYRPPYLRVYITRIVCTCTS